MKAVSLPTTYNFKIENIAFSVNTGNFHAFENESKMPPSVGNVLHYHALHELFLIGQEPLCIRTAQGEREYRDCAVFMPPFLEHSTCGNIPLRLLFSFEKTDARHTEFSDFIEGACSSDAPFAAHRCEAVAFYQAEFLRLSENGAALSSDMAASVLKLLFYHIFEQNKKEKRVVRAGKEATSAALRDSYIIKIDTLVNDYRNPVTLQTVADALCLSTKQTSRIIRRNYNKSLSELMADRRLRVAAVLLTEDRHSVSEIVQLVHFSSERYFYFQFKKKFGCTPQEYKQRHAR